MAPTEQDMNEVTALSNHLVQALQTAAWPMPEPSVAGGLGLFVATVAQAMPNPEVVLDATLNFARTYFNQTGVQWRPPEGSA